MPRRRGRKIHQKNFDERLAGKFRTTRAGRMPKVDHGTAELLAHRAHLVGRANVKDQRAGDPLGVLVLAGVITDEQRQAGLEFARLHWAMYGRPFSSVGRYNGELTADRLLRLGGVYRRGYRWNRSYISLTY